MNTFIARFRHLSVPMCALLFFHAAAAYGRHPEERARAENVRSGYVNGNVVVRYDLLGPAGKGFRVGILLLSKADPAYRYRPVNVTGDVGSVQDTGRDRQIVWEIAREFPRGLDTSEYFFGVDAEIARGGISPWVLIGGAAVIAGCAAVILLSRSGGTQQVTLELPDPVGRPKR
jgi:hypothetical protein